MGTHHCLFRFYGTSVVNSLQTENFKTSLLFSSIPNSFFHTFICQWETESHRNEIAFCSPLPHPQTYLPVWESFFPFLLLEAPHGTSADLPWIPLRLASSKPGVSKLSLLRPRESTFQALWTIRSLPQPLKACCTKAAIHSKYPSCCGWVKLYLQKQMLGWTVGPSLLVPDQGTCFFSYPFPPNLSLPSSGTIALQANVRKYQTFILTPCPPASVVSCLSFTSQSMFSDELFALTLSTPSSSIYSSIHSMWKGSTYSDLSFYYSLSYHSIFFIVLTRCKCLICMFSFCILSPHSTKWKFHES